MVMRYFALGLIVAINSACTTMQPVEVPDPQLAVAQLEVGDTVELVMTNGEKMRFKIRVIEEDALIGDGDIRASKSDIQTISVQKVSAVKTTAAGLGTVVVVGLVALALFAISLGSSF